MATKSYIIIGSGVFGASTAFYLSRTHPDASITLLDRSPLFPCPLAASHDYNKIVRADYGNMFYCKLALEARELWKNDALYKPFYHQSGMVNICDKETGRHIIENYSSLKEVTGSEIIGPEDLKGRYEGLFAETDYTDVDDIFVNPTSGWAEAALAVRRVIEAALDNGIKYVEGDVKMLSFGSDGECTGVELKSGEFLSAQKIVLCTGAGTAKLLADSAPNRKDLQVEDRITAAAVVTGVIKLDARQRERFKSCPAFIHGVGEVLGQVLPPTQDGILKFCVDVSFMNTFFHEKSGQMISAPPDQPDQRQHTVSQKLIDECSRVVKGIFGNQLENEIFESFRICWDGYTPNQDFIISAHSCCQNLYIATGGSFHGWKFLPILGKYVVKLLDGELEDDLVKRWAWDRSQDGSAHEKIKPRRELSDLM